MTKKRVAVFFGGRSPEHDVSIVTGLQVLNALRQDLYDGFPVYVSTTGELLMGEGLLEKQSYLPSTELRRKLVSCTLYSSGNGGGALLPLKRSLFAASATEFDVAIPAFHGAYGEDGCFQGLMEFAGIPYTGMRVLASSISMDKTHTKTLVAAKTQARQLPYVSVEKVPGRPTIAPPLPDGWHYPVIVKPARMGSSIGVAKADSAEEVASILQTIFLYDSKAMLEPYVAERTEFNVAVRRSQGRLETSAIEQPKTSAELLDFREKYVSGGGKKQPGMSSEGMLSLTREINPKLDPKLEGQIRKWATEIFEALDGTGSPRLDFMFDVRTGDLWFNEINPCPGSFAYFLWEAAENKMLFSEMLTDLINEALGSRSLTELPVDPVPSDARLFRRS